MVASVAVVAALVAGAVAAGSARPATGPEFLPRRAPTGWPMKQTGDRPLTRAAQIDQSNPPGRPLNPAAMRGAIPVLVAGAEYDPLASDNPISEDESDTPAMRVDPNSPDSPFVGVGSLRQNRSDGPEIYCSCVAIGPRTVLAAAHCFDVDKNGVIDTNNPRITFNGAAGEDVAVVYRAADVVRVELHPSFIGLLFNNLHDDVAVLTLGYTDILGRRIDLPSMGVPVYPLFDRALPGENDDPIPFYLVGYGVTGDGINGFNLSELNRADIKRVGENVYRDAFLLGEDPGEEDIIEVLVYDFDGPPSIMENAGFEGVTLGNRRETLASPGDSGAPLLVHDDLNGDQKITADELVVFGVQSFVIPGALELPTGQFGNWGGAMAVNAYLDFIVDQLDLCEGDIDFDRVIDGSDLAILMQDWGGPSARSDLTSDGVVDGADLAALLARWGGCP
jgi:hypothetical protein